LRLAVVAEGLAFPEGPVALEDGDIVVAEIAAGRVSRLSRDGRRSCVAQLGGGPNGLALGPGTRLVICNNGGCFTWTRRGGGLVPHRRSPDYDGGRIEILDLASGRWERLYDRADGLPLSAPNDLVCDAMGGFWFSDHGLPDSTPAEREGQGICYARLDGSRINRVWRLESPNGVGLSPDGRTLYAAETFTGRLWAARVEGPGQLGTRRIVAELGHSGQRLLDSLKVEASGAVVVAGIMTGGLVRVTPDDGAWTEYRMPDPVTTNLCFAGADLKMLYVTLSSSGRLARLRWPHAGLSLAHSKERSRHE
jgi:gluconolactonase